MDEVQWRKNIHATNPEMLRLIQLDDRILIEKISYSKKVQLLQQYDQWHCNSSNALYMEPNNMIYYEMQEEPISQGPS